jgi:predicted DNA-binding antitoxin AbrB/MazE fold protein
METQEPDAVYEQGVFRPTDPKQIELDEGQRVRLIIESEESVEVILDLASDVFAEMSPDDIAEMERIIQRRRDFFGEKPEL